MNFHWDLCDDGWNSQLGYDNFEGFGGQNGSRVWSPWVYSRYGSPYGYRGSQSLYGNRGFLGYWGSYGSGDLSGSWWGYPFSSRSGWRFN